MNRFVCSLLLLSLGWAPLASADAGADDWLVRMGEAASGLDYDGVFIHVDGNEIDTMRIVHKVRDDGVHERLYSLNGTPREVIRDPEKVWCFMPDRKMGVLGPRSGRQAGFPGFMISNLEQITESYTLVLGEQGRVADRIAQIVHINPRDAMRYGYELWADMETGLLLKSVLVDADKTPLEQYQFASIEIGNVIPDAALEPVTPRSELEWRRDRKPPRVSSGEGSRWKVNALPEGYRVVNTIQRWMPMEEEPVEHIVISDGLGAISVFIERPADDVTTEALSRMGAVTAYSTGRDGWQVTVIGEVPPAAVKLIGSSLVRNAP